MTYIIIAILCCSFGYWLSWYLRKKENKKLNSSQMIEPNLFSTIDKIKYKCTPKIEFSIEYYPITNRYYPKYGNKYIGFQSNTGILKEMGDHLFPFALNYSNEKECDSIINLFKEQALKENIKIIKR